MMCENLNSALHEVFAGKVVRKDLTKKNKRRRKRACLCIGVSVGHVLRHL